MIKDYPKQLPPISEGNHGMGGPGMDAECYELCRAINRIPGIHTVDSCCGHSERPYHVFFHCKELSALAPLAYWVDGCHSGAKGFQIIAYTDCSMAPIRFMIEGPVGKDAFDDAKLIAKCLNEYADERKW